MTTWLAHPDVVADDSASTRGPALPVEFTQQEHLIDDSWLSACAESAEPASSPNQLVRSCAGRQV